jgi:hypothetical protein
MWTCLRRLRVWTSGELVNTPIHFGFHKSKEFSDQVSNFQQDKEVSFVMCILKVCINWKEFVILIVSKMGYISCEQMYFMWKPKENTWVFWKCVTCPKNSFNSIAKQDFKMMCMNRLMTQLVISFLSSNHCWTFSLVWHQASFDDNVSCFCHILFFVSVMFQSSVSHITYVLHHRLVWLYGNVPSGTSEQSFPRDNGWLLITNYHFVHLWNLHCGLLGYYTIKCGRWLPTFWRKMLLPSLG